MACHLAEVRDAPKPPKEAFCKWNDHSDGQVTAVVH